MKAKHKQPKLSRAARAELIKKLDKDQENGDKTCRELDVLNRVIAKGRSEAKQRLLIRSLVKQVEELNNVKQTTAFYAFDTKEQTKGYQLSPARMQFQNFKQKFQDCILFFSMGDFYESFFEDAETCSKVLGIELTSRDIGSDKPVQLAGIPWHAFNGYLKKMLQAGYKVAVCEQVEDPKTAKKPIKRDVVRIFTPGKPKGA